MPDHAPYAEAALNQLYNMLFADDPADFAGVASGRLAALVEESPHPASLTAIAVDGGVESRLRVLAYRRLAQLEWPTSSDRPLLGVIVEVALDEGLDVLAAYADGSLRYINHAGGATIVESAGPLDAQVAVLFDAARPLVAAIGPWLDERLPPPPTGQARISLLVGPDLYFGQGSVGTLSADILGGPVMDAATALLHAVALLGREDGAVSGDADGGDD